MKVNKQKIEQIKNKLMNIKEKIKNNKGTQTSKKQYVLFILMISLGVITLYNNINKYNKSKEEQYKEYVIQENSVVNTNNVEVKKYEMAQSSISTDTSNVKNVVTILEDKEKSNKGYIMPIEGEVIKEYAVDKLVYSKTLQMWKTHPGIDIKCEIGTEIKSASTGVVQQIEKDSFYGNVIKILDNNGYTFVYSNLDGDLNIQKGEKVGKGDIIGKVGVSAKGELADETHLHFEVLKEETHINPQQLISYE